MAIDTSMYDQAIKGSPNFIDSIREGMRSGRQRKMQNQALERQAMLDERKQMMQDKALGRQAELDAYKVKQDETKALRYEQEQLRIAMNDDLAVIDSDTKLGLDSQKAKLAERRFAWDQKMDIAASDPNSPLNTKAKSLQDHRDWTKVHDTAESLRKMNRVGESVKQLEDYLGQKFKVDKSVIAPHAKAISDFRALAATNSMSSGQKHVAAQKIVSGIMETENLRTDQRGNIKLWSDSFLAPYPAPDLSELNLMANLAFRKNPMDLDNDELKVARRLQRQEENTQMLTPAMLDGITKKEVTIARVGSMIDNMNDPEWLAKNGDKFGQFNSRFADFKSAVIGSADDTKVFMKIRSLVDSVYEGAGKQLSDAELKMAKSAWIPNERAPLESVKAALEVMKGMFQLKLDTGLRNMQRAGFVRNISDLSLDAMYDPSAGAKGRTKAKNALLDQLNRAKSRRR